MKHLAPNRRLARLLALLIALGCQSRGGVREAPPATYPDPVPLEAPASPPFADEPAPSDDGYAEPPGSAPPAPASEHDEPAPQRAAPAESGAVKRGAAAPKSAASPLDARRESSRARRPVPEERPGLATHWGEYRYSPARQVDFERRDGDRPAAVVELHYDDRAGARRLLPRGEWGRAEAWLLGGVRVSVVDAAGRALPALRSGSRVVGVGAPGERYALSIENSTGSRFEVVASVDGLDVLDGESASFGKRGYLVGAYSSVLIDGFRRSDAEVAAFRLGDVARSYAASKGKARNVGVLGFALFEERRPRPVEPRRWVDGGWVDRGWGDRRPEDDTRLRREADAFPGGYARPPVW